MIPDSISRLLAETLGDGWTISRPRDGWAETAFVAVRGDRRVFLKTGVGVPILRRLAELEITPPMIALGEFEGHSYVIQEFVDAAYPDAQWFAEHLSELAYLVRTYQQDELLHSLLAAPRLTYFAEDLSWVERCYSAVRDTYGDHTPIQAAYTRLLEQLPEVGITMPGVTHGDLSRKNFLPTPDRTYLVDWDAVALSDPMRDLGPFLWWYVPPTRWQEFLLAYDTPLGEAVFERMYWWAARTSLEIVHGLLARGYSRLATDFLIDFLAAVEREDNPHPRNGRPIPDSS